MLSAMTNPAFNPDPPIRASFSVCSLLMLFSPLCLPWSAGWLTLRWATKSGSYVSASHFIIASFLLTAPLVANADISEATFTPQGSATYTPIDESQVEIYVFQPAFKFKVIGVIEARGRAEESRVSILDQLRGDKPAQPGEKEDIALATRALRREAAQAGALGVVIVRSVQERISQNVTERRIVAAAIHPE